MGPGGSGGSSPACRSSKPPGGAPRGSPCSAQSGPAPGGLGQPAGPAVCESHDARSQDGGSQDWGVQRSGAMGSGRDWPPGRSPPRAPEPLRIEALRTGVPRAGSPATGTAGVQAQRVRTPVEVLIAAATRIPRVGPRREAGVCYRGEVPGVRGRDGVARPVPAGLAVITGGKGLIGVRWRVISRPPLLVVSLSPPPPVPAHSSVLWLVPTISPGGRPATRSASRAPCSSRAAAARSTACRRARPPLPPWRRAS